MTEKKDPNAPGTLTAERFIAKLRRRDASSGKRLHDALRAAEYRFNRRESAWRCAQLADVIEAERAPAVAMAKALDLEIAAQPEQATPAEESQTDGIPEALRNPLPESRLKIGQRR